MIKTIILAYMQAKSFGENYISILIISYNVEIGISHSYEFFNVQIYKNVTYLKKLDIY